MLKFYQFLTPNFTPMSAKKSLIILAGFFILALPLAAWAVEETATQSVYVGAEEIVQGNFLKVGNTIDIKGAVNGDVIAAGNTINISGPVAGDVIALASAIKITGPVYGSIRVLANTIEINNEVSRNVWAVGNTILIGHEARIGWDIYATASNVDLRGKVLGNVYGGAANFVIAGEVAKNAELTLDTGGKLILEPEAKISGDLTYRAASEKQLVLKPGAQVSGQTIKKAIYSQPLNQPFAKQHFGLSLLFFKMISFFGMLIVGLVLITFMPKAVLETSAEMSRRPAVLIGWGIIYAIVVPVLALLLAVTVIGLPLAFILIPLYLVAWYLSKILASFALGGFLIERFSASRRLRGSLVWPLVVGLIVFLIITSLPFIGWLVKLVLVFWTLGALMKIVKEILRDLR